MGIATIFYKKPFNNLPPRGGSKQYPTIVQLQGQKPVPSPRDQFYILFLYIN